MVKIWSSICLRPENVTWNKTFPQHNFKDFCLCHRVSNKSQLYPINLFCHLLCDGEYNFHVLMLMNNLKGGGWGGWLVCKYKNLARETGVQVMFIRLKLQTPNRMEVQGFIQTRVGTRDGGIQIGRQKAGQNGDQWSNTRNKINAGTLRLRQRRSGT